MSPWRLVISTPQQASLNMGIDEVLLASAVARSQPVLRLYSWDPPAVSIGYAQAVERHIHLDRCRQQGIPIVRRMTGGKAVFHDLEVTYCLSGPPDRIPFIGDLMTSYRTIASALLRMLTAFGLNGKMAPADTRASRVGISSCFAAASAYEITIDDRKIIGSAQKRTQNGILQHGSILLDYQEERWRELMCRGTEGSMGHVTSLMEAMGAAVSKDDVISAMVRAFEDEFGMRFEREDMDELEQDHARQVSICRYPNLA